MARLRSIPPARFRFVGGAVGKCATSESESSVFAKNTYPAKARELRDNKINPQVFRDKLAWLQEHLLELKDLGASKEKVTEIIGQIERLGKFLKGLVE